MVLAARHRVLVLTLTLTLTRVLVRFRNGSCRILVATNVAARGLDVAGIGLVVCYELSGGQDCGELYTHRVGRTARAESAGEALSLVALASAELRDGGRDGGRGDGRGDGGGGRSGRGGGRGGGGRDAGRGGGGRGGGGGSGGGSELGRLEAIEASLGGERIPRVKWADAPENTNSAGRRAGSPGAAGLAAGWSAEWRTLLVQHGVGQVAPLPPHVTTAMDGALCARGTPAAGGAPLRPRRPAVRCWWRAVAVTQE